MAHPQLAPPAVVLFDRTAEQSFNNSNLTATGRDYINVSVNVGTAGAGYPFPSTSQVSQGLANSPTPPLQDPKRSVHRLSILARIFRMFRRLRHRYEKRPQTTAQTLSEPERAPQVPTLVLPQDDPISSSTQSLSPPLLETPSPDSHALSHPSSILAFDRCCQSSQPRLNVSSEEEVYERCLLPKGQGYPLFNPQPLRYPVKPGDFGILGQDGFDPIGNLFDPIDQQQFKINRPPKHEVTRQPRKLKEGQTIATGIEDARKVADHCDNIPPSRFDFHCRANQGAVLALTSSGELETLTQKSRNQLREYLCNHGTQLMANLHREHYLEHGQSLYVVTGTIKSGCWAIAVHTSPMREPYDQVVLTRREDKSGDAFPTYDWTVRGSADARSGASDCINAGAERTKDQCLFLRGFLVTPSLDFEVKTNPGGGSSAGGSSSNLDSSSNEEPYHRKGGSASQGKGKDPDWDNGDASSGSSQALQFQSKRALDTRSLVQPFPALRLDVKSHYPSRRINEMLIQNHENTSMAITHDDDWRHIMRNDYFDDNALSTLVGDFRKISFPLVSRGVVTAIPVTSLGLGDLGSIYHQYLATHDAQRSRAVSCQSADLKYSKLLAEILDQFRLGHSSFQHLQAHQDLVPLWDLRADSSVPRIPKAYALPSASQLGQRTIHTHTLKCHGNGIQKPSALISTSQSEHQAILDTLLNPHGDYLSKAMIEAQNLDRCRYGVPMPSYWTKQPLENWELFRAMHECSTAKITQSWDES